MACFDLTLINLQISRKLARFDDFSNLTVHVALDHQLALEDIDEVTTPLLLIVPLRLGLNELNPIYIPALKRCFEIAGTLGIIGGRPNQALYFIGYVGEEALYLDPHTCQRSGSINGKEQQSEVELDDTFHQRHAGRINFASMDPSIAVAFLCKTQSEFEELIGALRSGGGAGETPLFEIVEQRAQPWISTSMSSKDLEHDLSVISGCGEQSAELFEKVEREDDDDDNDDDDDFEIID
jgi:cysteine protease ATG4